MEKTIRKQILTVLVILPGLMFVPFGTLRAAITDIKLFPANPTPLSDTRGYYLAGAWYDSFKVDVIDPAASAWGDVSDVRVVIDNGANDIIIAVDPTGTGDQTANVTVQNYCQALTDGSDYGIEVTGTPNKFTVAFRIRILWTAVNSIWATGRSITASATATSTATVTETVPYGIISTIRVVGLAMTGEASDGMINTYHGAFNVTGTRIAYNISGATASDAVAAYSYRDIHLGLPEITSTTMTANALTWTDATESDGLSYAVLADDQNAGTTSDGNFAYNNSYTVQVTAAMNTGGASVNAGNTLSIDCGEVEVTDIIFMNGGGVDNDPAGYYRSTLVAGTQVRVNVRMRGTAATPVVGDLTIQLRDSEGNITAVPVLSGRTYGINNTLTVPTVASGSTDTITYEIYNIIGGNFGVTVMGSSQYENISTRIIQPVTHRIYWENGDAPGASSYPFNSNAPYPNGAEDASSSTSESFRIRWDPLPTATPDGDFYSYRIYYKEPAALVWNKVDRDTYTADGRYYHTPVPGVDDLGNAATSSASVVGLKPLTVYEFRFSALDVFGNEVADPNRSISQTATTGPLGVTVQLTDGITTYADATFTDNLASTKPVVRSAITIIATISGDTLPTSVNLIAAGDGATQPEGTDDILGVAYETFAGMDISGNRWKFVIPSASSLLTVGTSVRFVLEVNQTSTSYVDHTPATDHTDNEFRFYISSAPAFTPWPTRILNNVITDKNPVAYPSYYLSDDANVSIKVYDIKGRPVAILLDGGFRKGGQNIKENGWRGHNKSNKMMGVGLYYVHFQAKRASDGKVILDQIKKVVIAK
jgi:hypothetical protein